MADVFTTNSAASADRIANSPRPGAKQRGSGRPASSARTEVELLSEISAKLDRLVAVLAAQGKDRDKQVEILAAADCDSAFVATLVSMSPGAVRKLPGWRRARGDNGAIEQESA
jgi:hypothetical protein